MKSFAGIFVFSIVLSILLNAQNNVKIQGTFREDLIQTSITLENFLQPTVFSQNLEIKDKKFSIEFKCEREDIYKLKFTQQNFVALVIKPGDNISLILNPASMNLKPEVTGSEQSARLYATEATLTRIKVSQDSLNTVYSTTSPTDKIRKAELEKQYNLFENNKNILLYNTIGSHIGDLVNLFFIDRLNIDQFYTLYEALDSAIYKKYNYNPAVETIHSKITSGKLTAVGSTAPDIKLPTPEGDSLNLYSIKGKIIIIDFWASWCRPCRMENPNMTSLYADYHSKGLEIFGVSLDKDKTAWVKAINDDKLTWYHVSDLKHWQSNAAKLYGVGSIPSMFVLNGDYKIIAKNIRGEQLRAFVAEQLK